MLSGASTGMKFCGEMSEFTSSVCATHTTRCLFTQERGVTGVRVVSPASCLLTDEQ